jgi:hypothetical protein
MSALFVYGEFRHSPLTAVAVVLLISVRLNFPKVCVLRGSLSTPCGLAIASRIRAIPLQVFSHSPWFATRLGVLCCFLAGFVLFFP